MRVGWIWGLCETQLPFPVHCAKERYHIYTDGKELGKAQLLCNTKCVREGRVRGVGGGSLQRPNWKKRFLVLFFFFCKLALVFCSPHVAGQWCHVLHHSQVLRGPSWCLLWSGPSILILNWRSTHMCALIRSCVTLHLPLRPQSIKTLL